MGKFLVEFDKKKCVGSGVCEAFAPEFWKVMEDGKAELKGSKLNEQGMLELEIDEKDFEINKQAAEGCPPNCIHVTDLEKKQKLI